MSKGGDAPDAMAKRFGYALKRAQHALRIVMDDELRPLALTTPQYAVLTALEAEPGMSNAKLARAAFVTPQTMHGLLTTLASAGLLARDPDPGHGRILRTQLTDRGRSVLAEAHRCVATVEDDMLASLGQAASVHITAALMRCADDLLVRKRITAVGVKPNGCDLSTNGGFRLDRS